MANETVQYGARNLRTPGPVLVVKGQPPAVVVGMDEQRRIIIIDNEGTTDLFVAADDQSYGRNLIEGGGVRIPPGTGRAFAVIVSLRVFVPAAAATDGVYRAQVETDS